MKNIIKLFTISLVFICLLGIGLSFHSCEEKYSGIIEQFIGYQNENTIVLTWNYEGITQDIILCLYRDGVQIYNSSHTSREVKVGSNMYIDHSPVEGTCYYSIEIKKGNEVIANATITVEYVTNAETDDTDKDTDEDIDEDIDDNVEESSSYYIKHPWGGGEWSWKPMKQQGNSYTYTGIWGATGAQINTSADNNGAEWYDMSKIIGSSSVAYGSTVTFTFTPLNNSENITIKAKMPSHWNNTITAWVWPTGGSGSTVYPSKDGEWYTYTHSGPELNIIFRNGTEWSGSMNQTIDMYFTTSTCIQLSQGGNEKATYSIVNKGGLTVVGTLSVSTNEGDNNSNNNTSNTTLDKPSNVYASLESGNKIKVKWESVSGASGYYVYRSSSAYGYYEKVKDTYQTCYYDNSPMEGSNYYKVKAYNSSTESDYSQYVSCTFSSEEKVTKPNTPTGLSASVSSSCIELSWNSVSGANSYYIYRGTSSYDCKYYKETYSTTYRDCDVSEGKTYYYKVSAKNSAGESSQSTSVSAEIKATKLDPPSNVQTYYDPYYGVQVTWNEVPLADKYYIYRSKSRNSGYSKVEEVSYGVYVDNNLPSGDQYTLYYKVQAHSSYVNKTSDYSEVAEVYIDKNPFPPCAPMNLNITPSSYDFKIKWDNNSASGCGEPTTQRISFWNKSTGSWTSPKTLSSNSYTLSMSTAKKYADGTTILIFIIEVENTHGCTAMSYEYNADTNGITTKSTQCQ